jgi:hypothetical protein
MYPAVYPAQLLKSARPNVKKMEGELSGHPAYPVGWIMYILNAFTV